MRAVVFLKNNNGRVGAEALQPLCWFHMMTPDKRWHDAATRILGQYR